MKSILVTGSAGFIGANLVLRLLESPSTIPGASGNLRIVGLDNLNDYYDPSLKEYRLKLIEEKYAAVTDSSCPAPTGHLQYEFVQGSIADRELVNRLFAEHHFDIVVNLAAQAGVRYSIENPDAYIESNIVGFYNILEACRHNPVQHLVYASSSSVYGGNKKVPFSTDDKVDNPVSLYAATKKANELMAYTYAHLYKMRITGLRFFTVYGDWNRPDMALSLFADAMLHGRSIKVFNHGDMLRDFTFVGDIVDGIVRVVEAENLPLYDIFNIGNHRSEKLLDVIETLASALGVTPKMEMLPMQPGDVYATYASIDKLRKAVGYEPTTSIKEGIPIFAKWYREYYAL